MRKVLFGLMAIVMCMSAVMFTSCSADSKLKKSAEAQSKQLPVKTTDCSIVKINYDENSHTWEYTLEYEQQGLAQLYILDQTQHDNFQNWYLYQNKDNKDLKDIVELLVKAKGTLKYVLTYKGGNEKIELTYSGDILQKFLDGKLEDVKLQPIQQEAAPAEAGAEEQAAPAEAGAEEQAAGEEATGEETGEEATGEEAAE